MSFDSIGTRMKENYENRSKTSLIRRMPVAIRLDGKAFHTFTCGLQKPFDGLLIKTMQKTTKALCENIQGCVFGYTQSDEITLILQDYKTLTTEAWFDYEVQKMCSISASMCTYYFNKFFKEEVSKLLSDKMLANNPMKRPEVVLKSIETRKKNRSSAPKKVYINIKEAARVYLYKWKDRELKRAQFKCELCGDDKSSLMVHHHKRKYKDIFFECCRKIGTAPSKLRVGTAEFDSLIYELRKYHEENTDLAQVLCEKCHAEVDQHFRQFRKDIQNEN